MTAWRWALIAAVLTLGAALALRGCGDARELKPLPTDLAGAPPVDDAVPSPDAPDAPAGAGSGNEDEQARVVARVHVAGLDGDPLPGMLPVATTTPNAFEEPVATGPPTDATGWSTLELPPGEQVYLRAWAPQLDYFANNFFAVPAMREDAAGEFTVTMAPAGAIEGTFFGIGEAALAGRTVEAMLHHPTRGPWWPARARTGAAGHAVFEPVPPGEFRVEFRVEGLGTASLPGVAIRPGGRTDLGKVRLEP